MDELPVLHEGESLTHSASARPHDDLEELRRKARSMDELPVLHEGESLSQSVSERATSDLFTQHEKLRRERQRRRTKQWSDGVIGLAHSPLDSEELEELAFMAKPRPLAGSRTSTARRNSTASGGPSVIPDFNTNIPTTQDVETHVLDEHGQENWRFAVIEFLHQKWVQRFFMALLILDVCILFVEVTLQAMFPYCEIILRDALSCVPAVNSTTDHGTDDHHDICSATPTTNEYFEQYTWTPQPDYPVGCDDHKWHAVHTAEEVLFVCTMVILSCFFVELNVLMVVLTPCVFFRQLFYLLDYFVISVSIALEIFFHVAHKDLTASLVGLMVIFRSWRYVRISHGIISVTAEAADQKFGRLLNYTEHLEEICREYGLTLPQEDSKLEKLRTEQEPELVAQARRHHAEEKRHKHEQMQNGEEEETKPDNHHIKWPVPERLLRKAKPPMETAANKDPTEAPTK